MKATRKLIPALAMLLISAVMMSTATFAWFSANSTATANGMTVSASAARNISIATVTYSDGTATVGSYSSVANLNSTVASMVPGSTAKSATPAFFYVSNSDGINTGSYEAAVNKTAFKKASDAGLNEDSTATVFVHKTVSLMATGAYESGDNHGNIEVTFDVSGGITSPVAPSLRIMLVVTKAAVGEEPAGTPTPYIFAPITTTSTTYKPVIAEGTYTTSSLGDEIQVDVNGTDIITGIKSEEAWTVDIYYWFEGQDAACTAANAVDINGISVGINFSFATAAVDGD